MPHGFRMGDHEFFSLDETAPIQREPREGPIRGATPPRHVLGFVVEADSKNLSPAARMLMDGSCCGHGEPTFAVFDLRKDGRGEWYVRYALDKDWPDQIASMDVATDAAGPWLRVFDRGWFALGDPTNELPHAPVLSSESGEELLRMGDQSTFGVAIGVEYPAECTSPDDVSWLALAIAHPQFQARVILSEELA